MKFLSNPGNSFTRRLCLVLALPLLLQYQVTSAQEKPDSVFEKMTLLLMKKDDTATKMKEADRQLFLYLKGFSSPDDRKYYYLHRDSLFKKLVADTTLKADLRKKLANVDSAVISPMMTFSSAVDLLMTKEDTAFERLQTNYQLLAKEKVSLRSYSQVLEYALLGLVILSALVIFLLWRRGQKAGKQIAALEEASNNLLVTPPPSKQEIDKKAKKLAEELKKAKEELSAVQAQFNTTEKERASLEKEKETLNTSLAELDGKHKIATESLSKTEKERKQHEETSGRLQENLDKLSAIQKEQDEQAKKMAEIVSRLETVMPPASFPDINSTLHAWFLLQEFIKGYKNKEFSVLSTPNFSKWVLQEEHTYPELDPTNLAGNAPIISFLIDLKKRKITRVAPDGSYLILVNQKITQPIFDSLESAE
jgi:hypothetical protein